MQASPTKDSRNSSSPKTVRMTRIPFIAACCFGLTAGTTALAQTVQLPQTRTFGAGSTLSVPDGGSMSLGRVARSADARSQVGRPLGPRGGIGREQSFGGISSHPRIYSLQELDEQVLAAAGGIDSSEPLSRSLNSDRRTLPPGIASKTARDSLESDGRTAAEFEQLARSAEARKRPGVAKLHWQAAARLGSAVAREHLAQGESRDADRTRATARSDR